MRDRQRRENSLSNFLSAVGGKSTTVQWMSGHYPFQGPSYLLRDKSTSNKVNSASLLLDMF
jgi:hypothetical protein